MKIISFSGIDSAGKGTQIDLLESYLTTNNIRYKTIWARGSWTPGIELVKKIVRKDRHFNEAEKQAYRDEARSNPKKQKIILILSILDFYWYFGVYYRCVRLFYKFLISDRYIWDAVADFRVNFSSYNFEEWLLWKVLMRLIPYPNPSFIFVISAEESIERGIRKREAHKESLELKIGKVAEYQKLINLNKWSKLIDGNLEVNKIHQLVKAELEI